MRKYSIFLHIFLQLSIQDSEMHWSLAITPYLLLNTRPRKMDQEQTRRNNISSWRIMKYLIETIQKMLHIFLQLSIPDSEMHWILTRRSYLQLNTRYGEGQQSIRRSSSSCWSVLDFCKIMIRNNMIRSIYFWFLLHEEMLFLFGGSWSIWLKQYKKCCI